MSLGGGQSVLAADLVRVLLQRLQVGFLHVKLLAVLKGNRVDDDVIVQMLAVGVGDNEHLIALKEFRKLQADVVRLVRRDIVFGREGLHDMEIGSAIGLAEAVLGQLEFLLRCLCHAVLTGDQSVVRLLFVEHVIEHVRERALARLCFNDCHHSRSFYFFIEKLEDFCKLLFRFFEIDCRERSFIDTPRELIEIVPDVAELLCRIVNAGDHGDLLAEHTVSAVNGNQSVRAVRKIFKPFVFLFGDTKGHPLGSVFFQILTSLSS